MSDKKFLVYNYFTENSLSVQFPNYIKCITKLSLHFIETTADLESYLEMVREALRNWWYPEWALKLREQRGKTKLSKEQEPETQQGLDIKGQSHMS